MNFGDISLKKPFKSRKKTGKVLDLLAVTQECLQTQKWLKCVECERQKLKKAFVYRLLQ